MRSKLQKILLAGALGAFLLPSLSASGEASVRDEEFHYGWQLRNFVGAVAGLFLPNQGEGSLTFKTQENGHLRTELTITSDASKEGEYFRYGSEIDTKTLQPIRAWSSTPGVESRNQRARRSTRKACSTSPPAFTPSAAIRPPSRGTWKSGPTARFTR